MTTCLAGHEHRDATATFFCWARRAYYGEESKPRRPREEVILEREAKRKAISERREFHKKRRAEREARRQQQVLQERK